MDNSSNSKVQTVVQGEAPESDEELEGEHKQVQNHKNVENIPKTSVPTFQSRVLQRQPEPSSLAHKTKKGGGAGEAIVVAGEASESEEEEVDTSLSEADLPPLKVDRGKKLEHGSSSDLSDVPMLLTPRQAESRFNRPKYDTLLHKKLRENNWQLYEHLVEAGGQAYLTSARSLSGTAALLAKSHNTVQDISHSLRLLTNDLFHLDDQVSIIQSCKLLPDINLPLPSAPLPPATTEPEAASAQET